MPMVHDSPQPASLSRQGEEPQDRHWRELLSIITTSLEDSKAEDISTIELDPAAALADAMVVASGRSARHVSALAERLMDDLRKRGIRNYSVEGLEVADWVLVDLGDVIVHIFRPEIRALYNLEKLWSPHAPRQH